jgi:hypothetical protein
MQSRVARARSLQTRIQILLGAAVAAIVVLLAAASTHSIPLWSSLLPVPFALECIRRYVKNRSEWLRSGRLERFHEDCITRIDHRFAGMAYTGEQYHVPDHPYESDLNILGQGSLFALLCTARTEIGRKELARYLLEIPDIAEAQARQESVAELMKCEGLREAIALLGDFEFRDLSEDLFSQWLGGTEPVMPALWVRIIALAAALLFAG